VHLRIVGPCRKLIHCDSGIWSCRVTKPDRLHCTLIFVGMAVKLCCSDSEQLSTSFSVVTPKKVCRIFLFICIFVKWKKLCAHEDALCGECHFDILLMTLNFYEVCQFHHPFFGHWCMSFHFCIQISIFHPFSPSWCSFCFRMPMANVESNSLATNWRILSILFSGASFD